MENFKKVKFGKRDHYPKTKMNNMICIIDWNKGQNDGYSKDFSIMYDNLEERVSSFGWNTKVIDGHDMESIRKDNGYLHTITRT